MSLSSLNAQVLVDMTGRNRYETACNIATNFYRMTGTVVLVNANKLTDSLCIIPYAKMKNAPLLLTNGKTLDVKTETTMNKLEVKNVIVVGGENYIRESLVNKLKKYYNCQRIAGKNRIETSKKVMELMNRYNPLTEVFVVNGFKGLPDAASVGK